MSKSETKSVARINKIPLDADSGWQENHGNVFRCQVYLQTVAESEYTATGATLLGISSNGTTEEAALEKITRQLTATIKDYLDAKQKIPWVTVDEPPHGAITRWVFVRL